MVRLARPPVACAAKASHWVPNNASNSAATARIVPQLISTNSRSDWYTRTTLSISPRVALASMSLVAAVVMPKSDITK